MGLLRRCSKIITFSLVACMAFVFSGTFLSQESNIGNSNFEIGQPPLLGVSVARADFTSGDSTAGDSFNDSGGEEIGDCSS